ncbi:MAG: hypothetical protein J0I90_04125 [Nitrosospira sp.]|nr:hypothetical protein [Nitrosospira sp.]
MERDWNAKGLSVAEAIGTVLTAAKAEPIAIEIILFLLAIMFVLLYKMFEMFAACDIDEDNRCRRSQYQLFDQRCDLPYGPWALMDKLCRTFGRSMAYGT